jgi:hypothetical protein
MNIDFGEVIRWLWISVGIFWLAGWLGSKPSARTQATKSRALQLSFELAAFYLLLYKQGLPTFLRIRLPPDAPISG